MRPDAPRSVGQFAWNTTTGEWFWDAPMYELHGYRDGDVAVSSDVVLAHKLGEYRARAERILDATTRMDHRFTNYHRIVDTRGRAHTVLVVGESRTDLSRPARSQRLCRGFMVDVTQDEKDSTRHAVASARQSTASIQQATGLLMGSLRLSEDAALALLRRISNHHNVKLRDLAPRFMAAAIARSDDAPRDLSQVLVEQATSLAVERVRALQTEP